jgi:hypothetical protein
VKGDSRSVTLILPDTMLDQVEAWRRANECTKSEACRQLILLGLGIAPLESAIFGARVQALNEARAWIWDEFRRWMANLSASIEETRSGKPRGAA